MPIPGTEHMLDRRSAFERIYHVLLNWIIDGTLAPGEKLSVEELADYFDTSRTPVREAIQRLHFQQLVNVYRNKKTCVAELDMHDISVWYRPLAALQAVITERACAACRPRDLDALARINHELAAAIDAQNKFGAFQADEDFHIKLLELSGNAYIRDVFIMLMKHVQRAGFAYFISAQPFCESVETHERIIACMRHGDSAQAVHLSERNWLQSMEELQKLINEDRRPPASSQSV